MKLEIIEPSERHAGPILVCDETHNDIAEFYHNEHATVDQSYETALSLAKSLANQVPFNEEQLMRFLLDKAGGICCLKCARAVVAEFDVTPKR